MFEQRKLKICNFDYIDTLKEQLLGLKFVKTEGGFIKVHGAGTIVTTRISGRDVTTFKQEKHDDHADALANACYAAQISESTPSAEWC